MKIQRDITNCPITGLARKADMYNFNWNTYSQTVTIDVFVRFYKGDEEVVAPGISPYSITLQADNGTPVNSTTGAYLTKDEEGKYSEEDLSSSVGEYDFFDAMSDAGAVDIKGLIKNYIDLASVLGRFDKK
jgi:hypothetical protein